MFRRHDNLKRAVALLGVVLTLSPAGYAAHFTCSLVGCSSSGTAELAEGSTDSCGHACDCSASCTLIEAVTVTDQHATPSEGEEGPCPCPPRCLCHRTPDPLDVPKGSSTSVELVVTGTVTWMGDSPAVTDGDQRSSAWVMVVGLAPESSVARCAQLCRFLI